MTEKQIAPNCAKCDAKFCDNRDIQATSLPTFCPMKVAIEKLGVAFCIGLSDEAKKVVKIFENNGFKVQSVVCKCGNVDKTRFGVPPTDKIGGSNSFEAACNPVLQAELLNQAGTGLNVTVGLCVGHDSLFFMHSKTPTTALIVKDRVTGHNPVIALYSQYHKSRL